MATKAKPKRSTESPESPSIGDSEKISTSESVRMRGRTARGLTHDTRANSMIDKGVDMAVGILVVGLLTAYLLPIAISELVGVDTSSWGNAESSLFELLPLFFVLAIVLFVVQRAMSAKKGN